MECKAFTWASPHTDESQLLLANEGSVRSFGHPFVNAGHQGHMALPEFQRGYVWNRDQVPLLHLLQLLLFQNSRAEV